MKKHRVALVAIVMINIFMGSAVSNSFDLYINDRMNDFSTVDESFRDALRSAGFAGATMLLPWSVRGSDNVPEKPGTSMTQTQKTYSGYTESQAINIVARTLYMEARSERKEGIDAVASVILNRAGGKVENIPAVCLKKRQFSCWNDISAKTPELYTEITPTSANTKGADQNMWKYCEAVATKLLSGLFKSTIGNRNVYHRITVTPDWDSAMTQRLSKGRHVFGYLSEYDGFADKNKIGATKPVKQLPNKQKQPAKTTYTVRSGDQLGRIALKFNTTVNRLLALNPKYKNNPNLIRVGDVIAIPGGNNGKRK